MKDFGQTKHLKVNKDIIVLACLSSRIWDSSYHCVVNSMVIIFCEPDINSISHQIVEQTENAFSNLSFSTHK